MKITRTRGDTYPDQITVLSQATGEPINITGYSFALTVDANSDPVSSATNLYSLVGVIIDGPNGVVEFSPSAVQADLVGEYFYDIQMTDTNGKKRTIVKGRYVYEQDVTK